MSATALVIERARELESELTARGAEGRGLLEKAQSLRQYLSPQTLDRVAWVARQRNRIAHEHGATLASESEFVRACDEIHAAIRAIPEDAVAAPPAATRGGSRPWLGASLVRVVMALGTVGALVWFVPAFGEMLTGLTGIDLRELRRGSAVDAPHAIPVTSEELYGEFTANQLSASERYEGKVVEVSGLIEDLGRNPHGNAFIALPPFPRRVNALITPSEVPKLAFLSRGEVVTLRCWVDGFFVVVSLSGCHVVTER